jgi:hypothetical protein
MDTTLARLTPGDPEFGESNPKNYGKKILWAQGVPESYC